MLVTLTPIMVFADGVKFPGAGIAIVSLTQFSHTSNGSASRHGCGLSFLSKEVM